MGGERNPIQLYPLTIRDCGLLAEVITAGNGIDGLTLLGRFRPDVLISDLVLPGLDRLEMLRVLRNNPEHNAMSIVVVSSIADDEIARRGGLPDDVVCLQRPIPFAAIEALLREKAAGIR